MSHSPRVPAVFFIEGILSFAANLLFIGIFFYTTKIFGWNLVHNFLLATAQGVTYIFASLASQKLAARLGNHRLLIRANLGMAVLTAIGAISTTPWIITIVVIAYVPLMALNWPVLEAAAAATAGPGTTLSRQIGYYNIVWAGTGAAAVALAGSLIRAYPASVFLLPLLVHMVIAALIARTKMTPSSEPGITAHAATEPEPELLHQRTTAMWLSRITLPSTYVVIYGLSALMPLLPVIRHLDPAAQTIVGSTWLASRFAIFALLGATVFWHTRPRLLLLAGIAMLIAFMGVAITPSAFGAPIGVDLPIMILAQVLLGAALGFIYTGSLYFGLVLSGGSTEHAGYHEALIGVGQVIGPGLGAATQVRWRDSITASAIAVALVIFASVVFAAGASARRQDRA